MNIRHAKLDEYEAVRRFYHDLIDSIADLPYGAGWIKDVYPSCEMLRDAIEGEELFVADDGRICGAMIVTHNYNESYKEYDWSTKAEDDEITVIHALGVHPDYFGKGVSKRMVRFVIEKAKKEGQTFAQKLKRVLKADCSTML